MIPIVICISFAPNVVIVVLLEQTYMFVCGPSNNSIQGFAESLQQECSKPAQNVMIELYCCGPGLLFWLLLFQIKQGLGSSRFCCKDSAKPMHALHIMTINDIYHKCGSVVFKMWGGCGAC